MNPLIYWFDKKYFKCPSLLLRAAKHHLKFARKVSAWLPPILTELAFSLNTIPWRTHLHIGVYEALMQKLICG